jgi:predicted component of type VI protein secretion system
MPTTVESVALIMLVIYGLVVTYLLYDQYRNQEMYMKDKVDYINAKTLEMNARERVLVGKETCDRELTRLKTIHKSALDVLNSYNPLSSVA